MKSAQWQCFPILFIRLGLHSPKLLSEFRWSPQIVEMLDNIHKLLCLEEQLSLSLNTNAYSIDEIRWDEINRWIEHASRRQKFSAPQILEKYPHIKYKIYQLLEIRHEIEALYSNLDFCLTDENARIWTNAGKLVENIFLRTTLDYTSWDFVIALEKAFNEPKTLTQKKCSAMLRSLFNYIARGTIKTCPLGFFCGTSVTQFANQQPEEDIAVLPEISIDLTPSRALLNTLLKERCISETHSIDELIHFDVSCMIEDNKLFFWRTIAREEGYVEQLLAIPSNKSINLLKNIFNGKSGTIRNTIDILKNNNYTEYQLQYIQKLMIKLKSMDILRKDRYITQFSHYPLKEALSVLTQTRQEGRTEKDSSIYELEQLDQDISKIAGEWNDQAARHKEFIQILYKLRDMGKDIMENTDTPSTVLSVNSYARTAGQFPNAMKQAIEHATSLSLFLAAASFPFSQQYRDREYFLSTFRKIYGDNNPVAAAKVISTHWQLLDHILSRVMKNDYRQISLESTQTWPVPPDERSTYGRIYQKLTEHFDTECHEAHKHLLLENHFIEEIYASFPRSTNVIDVTSRIASSTTATSTHKYELFIESITTTNRLTQRHFSGISTLGSYETYLLDQWKAEYTRYQSSSVHDSEMLHVELVATPPSPNEHNIDMRSDNPLCILALSEPVRPSEFEKVVLLQDIYLEYDPHDHRIRPTLGPGGREVKMSYNSPLSPSYNRNLHFLRYIDLMCKPVLVAPKYFIHEASLRCHSPRMYLDNLVITPERWVIPIEELKTVLLSKRKSQLSFALYQWRKKLGLPELCFAYTSMETKPLFIDFYSPCGLQNLLRLLTKQGETILIEECFPSLDQQPLQRNHETICSSLTTTLRRVAYPNNDYLGGLDA